MNQVSAGFIEKTAEVGVLRAYNGLHADRAVSFVETVRIACFRRGY